VHQWLTTQDAEEIATLPLAVSDDLVNCRRIETGTFLTSGDPASLAGQVAVVGYGYELEGGECLASLFPLLKAVESTDSLQSEIIDKFPQAFSIGSQNISQY
jgi:hypothetical protein